jgi:hypothetical protein
MGTCWKAVIAVGIILELGKFTPENALESHCVLRRMICREYTARAGDPMVMKKARMSSNWSTQVRQAQSTSQEVARLTFRTNLHQQSN